MFSCLVNWLIEKYGEHMHLFGKPKTSKKEAFEKIASAFSEAADVVSGEQCKQKCLKLEAKYKEGELTKRGNFMSI